MTDMKERRFPRWPLRAALSLLFLVEALFALMLIAEGWARNLAMIVNSVGLLVACVLAWREISWGRWLLVGLLIWRLGRLATDMASHLAPGDHRFGASLMLLAFYVAAGLLIASPLGRPRRRGTP